MSGNVHDQRLRALVLNLRNCKFAFFTEQKDQKLFVFQWLSGNREFYNRNITYLRRFCNGKAEKRSQLGNATRLSSTIQLVLDPMLWSVT